MKKIEILTGNVTRFLLIVFFIALSCVSLFSLDVSGTRWNDGPHGPVHLDFDTEGKFGIGYQEAEAMGTYSQTGNVITLNHTLGTGGNKLSIVETDHLLHKYKLVGYQRGREFFGGDRPSQGEKRKIDGIVVYVYNAGGNVNANARMREGPGLQYKSVMNYGSEQVVMPKGVEVTAYGRSENQTTIDGVTAYWYYCGNWSYYEMVEIHGWIWGGLIDLKK